MCNDEVIRGTLKPRRERSTPIAQTDLSSCPGMKIYGTRKGKQDSSISVSLNFENDVPCRMWYVVQEVVREALNRLFLYV